jgi:hypothetical protein
MTDAEELVKRSDVAVLPASRQASLLVLLLTAGYLGLAPLFYWRRESIATVAAAYVLPALLVVALVLATKIARAGADKLPQGILIAGLLLIIAGAAFDMIATVVHTPDLSQEQNVIARTLLDSGHGVVFVIAYALFCQLFYVGFITTLWIGLLRHRRNILESLHGSYTFFRVF